MAKQLNLLGETIEKENAIFIEWPDEVNPDEPFAGIKVNQRVVNQLNRAEGTRKYQKNKVIDIDRSRNPSVERFE